MLDHILDDVLLAHLKTAPALAALNGYTGQDNADHKLPVLTVSAMSDPLARSATRWSYLFGSGAFASSRF